MAACSGAGHPGSAPTPEPGELVPTREQFVAVADAICGELSGKAASVPSPTDPDDIVATLDEVIPLTEEALRKLRALTPPEGDEDDVASILDTFDRGVSVARELRAAVESRDPAGIGDAQQRLRDIQAEGNELARAYGMEACAAT